MAAARVGWQRISNQETFMRPFAVLVLASLVIAACTVRTQTVEQKPTPTSPPTVTTSSMSVGSLVSHDD